MADLWRRETALDKPLGPAVTLQPPVAAGSHAHRRRGYLDWLRGAAVLIMVEAHLLDSWTRFPDREAREFGWAMILGGLGAPLFLFLAGVSVAMSAGSKLRKSGDPAAASQAVVRRGVEIFGLAFLFRIQAWVLGWSSPRALLKVDILNIMGPSIMAAAALWRVRTTARDRALVFAAATLTVVLITPWLRTAPFIVALPEAFEAYFRPVPGLSNFVFLPWAGFVLAGAIPGVLLDAARTPGDELRVVRGIGIAGAALAALSYGASHLPSPFPGSYFWTTSPSFFFLRVGAMTLAIALSFAWESRPGGSSRWSPLRQLGRTSLFIYWIHVEMVYGLVSLPLHKALTFGQAWTALALFMLFMLACSIVKDRIATAWARRSG